MIIPKDSLLEIVHTRKGKFVGISLDEFDTEGDEFWPIALAQKDSIKGMSALMAWHAGDKIPCRGSLVKSVKIVGG